MAGSAKLLLYRRSRDPAGQTDFFGLRWPSKRQPDVADLPGARYIVQTGAVHGQSPDGTVLVKLPSAPHPHQLPVRSEGMPETYPGKSQSPQRRDLKFKQVRGTQVSPTSAEAGGEFIEVLRQSDQARMAWHDLEAADKNRPVSRGSSEASTATPSNTSSKAENEELSPPRRSSSRSARPSHATSQVRPQQLGSQIRNLPKPW